MRTRTHTKYFIFVRKGHGRKFSNKNFPIYGMCKLTFFNLSTFIPTQFLIFQCCLFLPGLPLSVFTSEDRLAALCKRLSALCFIFLLWKQGHLDGDLTLFPKVMKTQSFDSALQAFEGDFQVLRHHQLHM